MKMLSSATRKRKSSSGVPVRADSHTDIVTVGTRHSAWRESIGCHKDLLALATYFEDSDAVEEMLEALCGDGPQVRCIESVSSIESTKLVACPRNQLKFMLDTRGGGPRTDERYSHGCGSIPCAGIDLTGGTRKYNPLENYGTNRVSHFFLSR